MRPLLLLLACAGAALADEPQPDPATLHLPAEAFFVARVAAPERLDAIGRDLPLAQLTEDRRPLGDLIYEDVRALALFDRSQPIYFAIGPRTERTTLARAKADVTAEEAEARGGRLLEGGWIRIGPAGAEQAQPLALLPGDVSVCVPVGTLVGRHRKEIDEAVRSLGRLDEIAAQQRVPVPPEAVKFVRLLAAKVVRAIADLDDVHYALTWRNGKLESEGWIRTLERSDLRKWLEARKGTKPNGLIDLLPGRALYMVESAGTASALDGDVAALLDEAFGEGGRSLLLLSSPSSALHEHLTGQAAGAAMVHGMLAMGIRSVHEVKPGAKIAEAIAALDAAPLNRMLGGFLELKLERAVTKSGDTPIHRVTFRCPIPEAAMLVGQLTTCFAVEGNYLLVTQSAAAENEMRALILEVRSGERTPHPHAKAMERLMPDRHEGLSINLGALKPMTGLAALALPEIAQALNAIPDDLWLSTALAVRDGHIHLRGDWPLKEVLEFVAKVKAMDLER